MGVVADLPPLKNRVNLPGVLDHLYLENFVRKWKAFDKHTFFSFIFHFSFEHRERAISPGTTCAHIFVKCIQ